MRIVEKILYGLCGLLALILLFVALCHYNPELSSKIGSMLENKAGGNDVESTGEISTSGTNNADNTEASSVEAQSEESESDETETEELGINITVTVGTLPAAESADSEDATEEDRLTIPSKVAGLTGYIPVKATGTEITQTRADEIKSTLGKGNTGDNLEFNEEIYPYYGIINDTQKTIYKQIYANADDELKRFAPATDVTANDVRNAFTAVVNDHPELFWVDTAYKYKYTPKGDVADITLVFNVAADNLESSKSQFEAAAKLITDETYGHYTDYEKEKICHDLLISKVKYDANAPMNQSAYSALIYGRTVCAGYARALQYLLQQLDVPCYYVTGYAGQNHAWNIVKLDDGYYNVDSTWDDTDPQTYDYFNCSDADYASNHARKDLSIYLPACNGNRYSGLEVNPTVTKPETTTVVTGTQVTTPSTTQTQKVVTQTTANAASDNNTANNNGSITVTTVRGGGSGDYIDNLDDYFNQCFASMVYDNSKNIKFSITVTDKDLWDEIYSAYANGDSEDYIDRFLVEQHKNSCQMTVEATPQSDGSYRISHRAVVN
jgi:hypothetical protein